MAPVYAFSPLKHVDLPLPASTSFNSLPVSLKRRESYAEDKQKVYQLE